jgi:hypothetical protein
MAKLTDFFSQAEIDAHLEDDPDIIQGKLELAEEAVEYAKSISPVDSGDYRDGIKARRHGRGVGIYWTDPKSNLIEDGSIHNPEYAVQRRTEEHFRNGGLGR